MDAPSAGGVVVGRGELQLGRGGEAQTVPRAEARVVDRLHRSLAVRVGADDQAAVVVLNGSCDDLRRRRGGFVDKDDQRDRYVHERVTVGVEALLAVRGASAAGDDELSARKEEIGHAARFLQETAGVAAHVEHDAAHAALNELLEPGTDVVGRAAVEIGQPDEAHPLALTHPVGGIGSDRGRPTEDPT